jgi:hypothetical protein
MKYYKHNHPYGNSRVGDIENGPPGKIITEYRDIEKDHVYEIDDASVKQRSSAVEDTVKYAVDEIAEGAAQNKGERKPDSQRLFPDCVEVPEDTDAGDNRKDRKEGSSPEIDTKCHTGIFDIGKSHNIADNRYGLTVIHPFPHNTEERECESLYEDLGHLIERDDSECKI